MRLGINNGLTEIDKLTDGAVRVGKEIGQLEARLESLSWIEPMLLMVRGEKGITDYQVRVVGIHVLRGMSLWLNEKHGQDYNLLSLNRHVNGLVEELEQWKASES